MREKSGVLRNLRWLVTYQGTRWIIGFLMGAWVARVLGPGGYGVLTLAGAVCGIGMCAVEFGMRQLILAELSRRKRLAHLVAGTASKLWIASGALTCVAIGIWNATGPSAPRVPWWVMTGALTPLLLMFLQIHNTWEEACHRAFVAARNRMAGYLAAAGIRLLCLLGFPTVAAFSWTNASEHVVSGSLGAWFSRRRKRGLWLSGWSSLVARSLLSRGLIVVFGHVGLILLMRADTILLDHYKGQTETGIYGAAVRLSEMAYLVAPMIITVLLPRLAKVPKGDRQEFASLESKGGQLMVVVALVSMVCLLAFGPLAIRLLFGSAYLPSERVLQVHCLSIVPFFLMEWRSAVLVTLDRNVLGAVLSWLAAGLNIVLNLRWLPEHGALGAAWATLISYGACGLVGTWFVKDLRWLAWSQMKSLAAPVLWLVQPRVQWHRIRDLLAS